MALSAASRTGPSPIDLLALVHADDPRISPDGATVVWLETRIVPDEDATHTALVAAPSDGSTAPVTLLERPSLRSPRWSPDGRELAFVAPRSDADATPGVWIVGASGGEPRLLSDPGGPVLELAWSPRGDGLALTVRRHGPTTGPVPPTGVVRTGRLRWKQDGVGLVGDRWTNIVWCPREPGAAVRPLVSGPYDLAAPTWRPDGAALAFLGELAPEQAGEAARRRTLWLVDVGDDAGQLEPRRLATFADVRTSEIAWSHDGSALAMLAHDRAEIGHYGAQRLWRIDAATGERVAMSSADDGTLGNAAYTDVGGYGGDTGPRWLPDGASVVVPASRGGTVRLTRFTTDGPPRPLTGDDRGVAAFTLSNDGERVAMLTLGRAGPGEVEILEIAADGASPRTISAAGRALAAAVPGLEPRLVDVPADPASGAPRLDAWLLMPPGDAADRAEAGVPLVLYCGGGPGGMRSDNYFLEFQLFAHAGYAVLWLNARGCQGYGDAFCTAILGDWGGADWEDEQRALDAALAHEPALDPERLAIAGGSYGGYQVNWAIARSDRFRAAVSDRSVVNRLSAFGTSDIGFQRTFEYGGATPWEDPQAYLRQTPLQAVDGVTTPTLVIHSALDHRCPVEQGEQLYFALRARGVPAELLRFPNESHGLSRGGRPWHRIARLEGYLTWFDRWIGTGDAHDPR